jgi:hypothetical protein
MVKLTTHMLIGHFEERDLGTGLSHEVLFRRRRAYYP